MLKRITACLIFALPCLAVEPDWLKQLDPILSREERARLASLKTDVEQTEFAETIWRSKRISAEEYFRRLSHVDNTFGSGKSLSGFHTDRGRVYLSLGAPQQVSRLVSSRVFFPIEVWHYAAMPDRGINYECRYCSISAMGLVIIICILRPSTPFAFC